MILHGKFVHLTDPRDAAVETLDEIARLVKRCAVGVSITFNSHRDNPHVSIRELAAQEGGVAPEVIDRMAETGETIKVQCYPRTAVGFISAMHYDLADAIEAAHKALDAEGISP